MSCLPVSKAVPLCSLTQMFKAAISDASGSSPLHSEQAIHAHITILNSSQQCLCVAVYIVLQSETAITTERLSITRGPLSLPSTLFTHFPLSYSLAQSSTLKWTVMRSGRRRSKEKASPAVRYCAGPHNTNHLSMHMHT